MFHDTHSHKVLVEEMCMYSDSNGIHKLYSPIYLGMHTQGNKQRAPEKSLMITSPEISNLNEAWCDIHRPS